MAIETWYYGYADGVAPSKTDTGGMHDVGDGIYLTRDLEAARAYSRLRVGNAGSTGNSSVMQVRIDLSKFRVMNLVDEGPWATRWNTYLNTGGPAAPSQFIRRGSEIYNATFFEFLKKSGAKISDFELVIAPDFHSGATGRTTTQMVVLYKNKGPTNIHSEILECMQLVERNGQPVRLANDPSKIVGGQNLTPGSAIPRLVAMPRKDGTSAANIPTTKLARAARGAQTRNAKVVSSSARAQSAAQTRWSGYAMLASAGAQWFNNASVDHAVEEALAAKSEEIDAAFARGQGVLVIIHLAAEKHSEAGFLARVFQDLFLLPGATADEALARWQRMDRIGSAMPINAPFRDIEEYRWLTVDTD